MTNAKISALTGATTPLDGTETLPVVQSGATVKCTVADIQAASVTAGTANGIQYLNGIKVPTTSSALTYSAGTLDSTGKIRTTSVLAVLGGREWQLSSASSIFQIKDGSAGIVRATCGTTGDWTFNSGNLILGTAAKGINFTANTPLAGMTSRLLNWYEEGTWTGTLKGVTTDPTTPVIVTGTYTRIGRSVTVSVYFDNVNTTGASGEAYVIGLPFTPSGAYIGSVRAYQFTIPIGTTSVSCATANGASFIAFYCSGINAAWSTLKHNAGTSRYLNATVTYFI